MAGLTGVGTVLAPRWLSAGASARAALVAAPAHCRGAVRPGLSSRWADKHVLSAAAAAEAFVDDDDYAEIDSEPDDDDYEVH